MRFRAISVAAIAGLTWASVALAADNGSSATAYGGAAGAVQSQVSSAPHVAAAKGSTLPFTGLNLTLIVVGAIALLAIGFGLRRFSGDKA